MLGRILLGIKVICFTIPTFFMDFFLKKVTAMLGLRRSRQDTTELDRMEQVADNVYFVPYVVGALEIEANCTIWRSPTTGGLVLFSPCRPTPEAVERIKALGPVEAAVVFTNAHDANVSRWKDAVPSCRTMCFPEHEDSLRKQNRVMDSCNATKELERMGITTTKVVGCHEERVQEYVLELPMVSKTKKSVAVVTGDSIQNHTGPTHPYTALYRVLTGFWGLGMPRLFLFMFARDQRAIVSFYANMASRLGDNVGALLPSHGNLIKGPQALRDAVTAMSGL